MMVTTVIQSMPVEVAASIPLEVLGTPSISGYAI